MATRAILFLVMPAFGFALSGGILTIESSQSAPPSATSSTPKSGSPQKALSVSSKDDFSQTLPPAATVQFDIPAESLSSALLDFGRQAQVSLVLPSRPFEGLVSAPVYGELSTDDALAQLLRCLPFRGRTQEDTLIVTYRDGSALDDSPPATPIACTKQGALVS